MNYALIFDLDGTLTLTQQLHHQAYSQIFKQHGIIYTEEDDKKFAGQGSKIIFPAMFKKSGKNLTPQEIEKLTAQKKELYNHILENTAIKAAPGVEPFLESVKNYKISMAVATGNKLDATEKLLTKTNIRKYFKEIVSQKDVKNQKPAPDIFLEAAKRLGVSPENCIVFEDALNGIKAAKAAGMKAIAITTAFPKDELVKAGADTTIADYHELPVPCFIETLYGLKKL